MLIVAVVVVVALVAGGVAFALPRATETSAVIEPTSASPDTPPPSRVEEEPPSAPPDPGSTGREAFDATLDELMTFVEQERGLEFKEPVTVEVVDDDEFSARLLEDFDEDVEDLEEIDGLYTALGLIEPDVDLVESLRGLLDVGVLGFFDPETDELVVRGTSLTPYTQQTIVHELVHALDDQWFDLDRQEYDDADTEIGFGFSAVVEGNARRIENVWESGLSDEEQEALLEEELRYGLDADIDPLSFPLILVELISAPYELGEPLVLDVFDAGGQEGLDAAFGDPPATSEQVIHPERYLDGEEMTGVSPPTAGGEVFDEGVFGELVLRLMLDDVVSSSDARAASQGWGGDWYVAWRDGDQTCLRVDFAMDTSADGDELLEALREWSGERSGASVEEVGDLVRLTSCG